MIDYLSSRVPVIVDAGIGLPSHAARAMEHKLKRGKRLTDSQRRKVLELLCQGHPTKHIANEFGVTYAAIHAYKTKRVRAASRAA